MPTPLWAGPALITFGGQTFVAKDDLELDTSSKTFDLMSALGGTLDTRLESIEHTVSFTPDGRVVAGQIPVLYSVLSERVGKFLHQENKPLVIIQDIGSGLAKRRTYHNAEITGVPNLTLSSKATLHDTVTFTCLHKTDAEIGDANSLFTDDDVAWPGLPGYSPGDILTQCYHATWGEDAPWLDFYGRAGCKVSFNLSVDAIADDCRGIAGYQITNVAASASMVPVGPTPVEVSAALHHQGANAKIGGTVSVTDADLDLVGEGFFVRLRRAGITQAKATIGLKSLREGEVTWVAGRRMAANNTLEPLVYVGVAAPAP